MENKTIRGGNTGNETTDGAAKNTAPCFIKRVFLPYLSDQDDRVVDVLFGLRVIFIWIIAWFHIWQQSWLTPHIGSVYLDFLVRSGYEWVDAMLLLSGFLLMLPYANGKKMDVGAFYRKRFARIMPSYVLCIIVLMAVVVLPGHKYGDVKTGAADILAHLTFTHNLFPFSYTGSPLNGVLWTLAVEVQFYALFPLLAGAFGKHPWKTVTVMGIAAFVFRFIVSAMGDTTLYINQLPAFLDVYAIGFAGAKGYVLLRKWLTGIHGKKKILIHAAFTLLMIGAVIVIVWILQDQAAELSYDKLRLGQMSRRFPFALAVMTLMMSAAFSLAPVRFLLGNRVMRFLSGVTFQFYMYLQAIAVFLRENHVPEYVSSDPHMDPVWQVQYTWICIGIALALSVLITYVVEKPCGKAIEKAFRKADERHKQRIRKHTEKAAEGK